MNIDDIVDPIEDLTEAELIQRLRDIRRRRESIKPATVNRNKRAAKKGSQSRVSKVEALLAGLSEAEIETLLAQL